MSWVERVEVLEETIKKYVDNCNYFIIFDELDEDYKFQSIFMKNGDYLDVITGLFKAVYEVKAVFGIGSGVKPVMFLRDDIFSLIDDPDKTKWRDLAVELRWDAENIKPMIAFRISRALHPDGEAMRFQNAWNAIFDRSQIGVGSGRTQYIPIYEWITRHTMYRPRDYILVLQLCADSCFKGKRDRIFSGAVTGEISEYSRILRSEIRDEMISIIPYVDSVFRLISSVRKLMFSSSEFIAAYNNMETDSGIEKLSPEKILQALHYFSVIGNSTRSQKQIFRYRSPDATLNLNETIVLHPGLTKAFQVF